MMNWPTKGFGGNFRSSTNRVNKAILQLEISASSDTYLNDV